MKRYSLLLLTALAAAACSKDLPEEIEPIYNGGTGTLTLHATTERDDTRMTTDDGLSFDIVENEERIGVYLQLPGVWTEENILFTAGAADDRGWVTFQQAEQSLLQLQNGIKILAYAPYTANSGSISGSVEGGATEQSTTRSVWDGTRTLTLADLQHQAAASDYKHLPDYYAVVATPTEPTTEDNRNYKADLRFSGVFALARFVVTNPASASAVTISKLVFSAEGCALTGDFRVDLTAENPSIANAAYAPQPVADKTYDRVTVQLDTPVTLQAGEKAELFAVVNAGTVEHPKMEVYATDEKGKEIVYTKDSFSQPSYEITRQKRAAFGFTLENSAVEEPAYDEAAKSYTVTNAAQLAWIAEQVNAGDNFAGKTVVLAGDIDLNSYAWTPIGTSDHPFSGIFDGAGGTISNLVVNLPEQSFVGLFGRIATSGNTPATLKNISIRNAAVTGLSQVGAVAGSAYTGRVENCSVRGDIRIEGNYQTGGISGYGYASFAECSVTGEAGSYVKGIFKKSDLEGDATGGIVGYAAEKSDPEAAVIDRCSASIDVEGSRKVGGIAGQVGTYANLSGCTFSGNVKTNAPEQYIADNKGKIMVGGIFGELAGGTPVINIRSCTVASGSTVTGCDAATTGLLYGGCRNASHTINSTGNTTDGARLIVPLPEGIEQVSETAYRVTGRTGLSNFAALINAGDDFAGKTVTLTEDVDLTGLEWTPIANTSRKDADGGFKGIFDGSGHTVANLTCRNETDNYGAGLFGVVNGGTVKNVSISGGEIYSIDCAGVICGTMLGESIIENCHNEGVKASADSAVGGIVGRAYGSSNTITGCSNKAEISGNAKVGGIVGIVSSPGSTSRIENCINEGPITGNPKDGAAGIVGYAGSQIDVVSCTNVANIGNENVKYAAGIVGYKQGADNCSITSCTNSGSVAGNTAGGIYGATGNDNQPVLIADSRNSGMITGGNLAGGIAATLYCGSATRCDNTGSVTAQNLAGGVAGSLHVATVSACSGGTATVTAAFAGRLIGEVATGTKTATLSVDNANSDDYADLPTVGATSTGTSVSVLTVTGGTLHGALDNQSASHSLVIIAEGAAWDRYPGETGTWQKTGSTTVWKKIK